MLVPALLVLASNIISSSARAHSCECYPASPVQSKYPNRPDIVETQDFKPWAVPVNPQPVPVYSQPVPVNSRPSPPIHPRPSPADPSRPYYPGPFPSDETTALSPIDPNARPPYINNHLSNHPQPKKDYLPSSSVEPIGQSQPAPYHHRMGGSVLSDLV